MSTDQSAISIGVDAGTSVVKAVGFAATGAAVSIASRQIETSSSATGWAEQDLETILDQVWAVIAEVADSANRPVNMLAVTAQGDGLWLLDEGGRAVRPPILWSDGRAGSIVDGWQRDGTSAAAFRLNGNMPFSGSAAALLRWMADHEPESLERSRTAGYLKDAITQRLTGDRVTDVSDASLPFFGFDRLDYSPELLGLFGLSEFRQLLAPIDPLEGNIRRLTPVGAELSGLPAGLPYRAGPFDFPASMVGANVVRAGDGLIAFGSTLACGVLSDKIEFLGEPSGMTLQTETAGLVVRLLPAMVGTLALDWLLGILGLKATDLDPLLERSEPGSRGLLALPLLASSGERAPFVDSMARGRFVGISVQHSRADLALALAEGIAFAARHCLEVAGLSASGQLSISGGGTKSRRLTQTLANVMGRPLLLARQPESGARGAVIAALRSAGIAFDVEEWTRPDGVVEPDVTLTPLYDAGYARYRSELERARGHWAG